MGGVGEKEHFHFCSSSVVIMLFALILAREVILYVKDKIHLIYRPRVCVVPPTPRVSKVFELEELSDTDYDDSDGSVSANSDFIFRRYVELPNEDGYVPWLEEDNITDGSLTDLSSIEDEEDDWDNY